jgi:hypothetical protein
MRRRQETQVCTSITKCNPPYPALPLWDFKEKHLARTHILFALSLARLHNNEAAEYANRR